VRYAHGDLERARHRLLGMICEKLSPAEQLRCTVVFDAREAASHISREQKHHEVRVLFSPPEFEADDLIEQLIAQHPAPKQLVVVSGDHRLHKAARRRQAHPVDSDPFWERLQQRPDARTSLIAETPPQPHPAVKPTATSSATAAWLREFGNISVEELAEEVRAEEQSGRSDPWQQRISELEQTLDNPQLIDAWLTDAPRGQRQRPR
jgi:predicted RNA-binding protein with PIN domain